MKLELPESINRLVNGKYFSARSSGSLVFSSTELTVIRTRSGLPFQLRYCPALSKKPAASRSDYGASEPIPKPDPFDNPPDSLLVARLPNDSNATHNLVLNKYPVIDRHSIVSTIDFKKQTDLLESEDLDVTYSCLQAWQAESTEEAPSRLFAFYNSGEHSGASQPHRHLQLIPIEDMMGPGSPKNEWQPLIDIITEAAPDLPIVQSNHSLPFCNYTMRIPPNPGAGVLQHIYHRLFDSAKKSVQSWNEGHSLEQTAVDNTSRAASISYNLAMTTNAMALCPRRKESAMIPTAMDVGSVAVNGTLLGGTLMVKEKTEWEALKQGQVMIDDILAEVGIPYWVHLEDSQSSRL